MSSFFQQQIGQCRLLLSKSGMKNFSDFTRHVCNVVVHRWNPIIGAYKLPTDCISGCLQFLTGQCVRLSCDSVSSNNIKDIFFTTCMMNVTMHIDNGYVILRKQLWIIVT